MAESRFPITLNKLEEKYRLLRKVRDNAKFIFQTPRRGSQQVAVNKIKELAELEFLIPVVELLNSPPLCNLTGKEVLEVLAWGSLNWVSLETQKRIKRRLDPTRLEGRSALTTIIDEVPE